MEQSEPFSGGVIRTWWLHAQTPMNPLFFGSKERRLFGVFHPATAGTRQKGSVLICPPMREEYNFSHRALRQLSLVLGRRGFASLRFDYYGSGDSAGQANEQSLSSWRQDIESALEELKAIGGKKRLNLLGLRLGASLAAEISFDRDDIEKLILWDPIIHGQDYLTQATTSHQTLITREFATRKPQATQENSLLGYTLPPPLKEELKNFSLKDLDQHKSKKIYILNTQNPNNKSESSKEARTNTEISDLASNSNNLLPATETARENVEYSDLASGPNKSSGAWGNSVGKIKRSKVSHFPEELPQAPDDLPKSTTKKIYILNTQNTKTPNPDNEPETSKEARKDAETSDLASSSNNLSTASERALEKGAYSDLTSSPNKSSAAWGDSVGKVKRSEVSHFPEESPQAADDLPQSTTQKISYHQLKQQAVWQERGLEASELVPHDALEHLSQCLEAT